MTNFIPKEFRMRQKRIESIVAKAASLGSVTEKLVGALNGFQDAEARTFEIGTVINGRDSTVAQIVGRIHGAIGIVAEYGQATRSDLVPLQTLTNLETSIDDTIAAIDGLLKAVDNISRSQGGLKTFNYSNFHAVSKNGNSHDTRPQFHTVFDKTETFLQRFFESLLILKPRAAYSFQSAASGISTIIEGASARLSDLQATLKKVDVVDKNLAAKSEEAASHLEEIKRLKNDGMADRKTVADYLAEVTQHKAAVDAIHGEAASLEANVKTYQTKFDQFQKQLDERERVFTDGTKELADLIERFENQASGVDDLTKKSVQMLSSATVSGLAANFSTMTTNLTNELWWARVAFYIGIFFLTVSALPLLAFVLLPVIAPFMKNFSPEVLASAMQYSPGHAQNGWQYLGQVIARIVILLPAAWFVSFAAIRHSSLFRLREHYAYKYSMAVAVEGFKQQAPEYDQEIAALVLEQLAFNPADKLTPSKEIREGKVPGIAGYLLEKIQHKLEKQIDRTAQK